jgi:hypothetical protein
VWLSGAIITPLNKLIFPVLWMIVIGWLPITVLLQTGQISVAKDFRWLVVIILLGTAWMLWFSWRLHRVGYAGRELVISNYWREERIRFDQVLSVDSVWWYRRRLVRVELRPDAPIGPVIYYIPKWAAFRGLWTAPEKELREIMS